MDVFEKYKPIRNKIANLAVEEALATIWAYCQFLQIANFRFPMEIEVPNSFVELDIPQQWISEWELELLAKEVILNGNTVASKGHMLRIWKNLSDLINALKTLENDIYGKFGSPSSILMELVRISHRQFIWQGNRPNSASTIRYFKIFNRPGIDRICFEKTGLSIWEVYMCGTTCLGHFLNRPEYVLPLKSEMKLLPVESFDKFFAFTSLPLAKMKTRLKSEQQYNENFAYAFNSLRTYPLVRMDYQGKDAYVCPLMTLLYWRFTGGLYYEFIDVPEFGNEFGDGFQDYIGEVIERACPRPMQRLAEVPYFIGKNEKRTVDWIVADEHAALFVECKAKRLSWGAKISLNDLQPLETNIENMAAAVVQVYKTIIDHLNNDYPHFPVKAERKIFPLVVTLENWQMFGPLIMNKLETAVIHKFNDAAISPKLIEEMPYSVWAVEDLEVGLQIMKTHGIAEFMEGKLRVPEMRDWAWHGYMTNNYRSSFPTKKLFSKEYDEMFSGLLR